MPGPGLADGEGTDTREALSLPFECFAIGTYCPNVSWTLLRCALTYRRVTFFAPQLDGKCLGSGLLCSISVTSLGAQGLPQSISRDQSWDTSLG